MEHIQPDEPNFVDGEHLQWLNTTEEVIDSRQREENGASYADALWINLDAPTCVELIQFVRNDAEGEWARGDDAELGRRIGALRHARNYPEDDEPFYKGVRQLWWPTMEKFEDGVATDPEAFRELLGHATSSLTLLTKVERFKR